MLISLSGICTGQNPPWGWLPLGASHTRPDRAHQNPQASLYCLLSSTCFSYPKTNFPPGSKAHLLCTSKALRMQGRHNPHPPSCPTDPEQVLKVGIPVQRPWEAGKGGALPEKKRTSLISSLQMSPFCRCLIIMNMP